MRGREGGRGGWRRRRGREEIFIINFLISDIEEWILLFARKNPHLSFRPIGKKTMVGGKVI